MRPNVGSAAAVSARPFQFWYTKCQQKRSICWKVGSRGRSSGIVAAITAAEFLKGFIELVLLD